MYAKYYENPIMLSRVTAKNVGDVFFETHCRAWSEKVIAKNRMVQFFDSQCSSRA